MLLISNNVASYPPSPSLSLGDKVILTLNFLLLYNLILFLIMATEIKNYLMFLALPLFIWDHYQITDVNQCYIVVCLISFNHIGTFNMLKIETLIMGHDKFMPFSFFLFK